MERRVSFGEVIGATFGLMSSDLRAVLSMVVAIAAAVSVLDIIKADGGALLGIPILVVQYYMIRRVIDRQGLRSADKPGGFGSFFILGIMTGVPILLGYVLLVLPGLYLSARWAMVDAALLAENRGSSDAMGRSWNATKGYELPVALTFVLINLPMIAAMIFQVFSDGAVQGSVQPVATNRNVVYGVMVIANLLLYASQVTSWYFGVALYQLLVGPAETQLNEVFA